MRRSSLLFIAMQAISPGLAEAANWQTEALRGVETHVIAEGEYRLRLICDPSRVYGADASALYITRSGQPLEGDIVVTFNLADHGPIELRLANGSALRSGLSPQMWQRLVEGFASGAEFALVSAAIQPIFKPDGGIQARCR